MNFHVSDRQRRRANMIKNACILFIIEQQDIESLPKGNIITKTCRQRKRLASGKYETYNLRYEFVDTEGRQYYVPKRKSTIALEKKRLVMRRRALEEEAQLARTRLMKDIKREAGHSKKRIEAYLCSMMELARKTYINKTRYQKYKDRSLPFVTNEEYRTDNGEFVRSKNECMFANKLKEMGIPYIYEVNLRNAARPDFTLFIGEDVIHIELLGMMNGEDYREDLEIKKYSYSEMKIHPVYIDMTYGVDTKKLEAIILCIVNGRLKGETVSCRP